MGKVIRFLYTDRARVLLKRLKTHSSHLFQSMKTFPTRTMGKVITFIYTDRTRAWLKSFRIRSRAHSVEPKLHCFLINTKTHLSHLVFTFQRIFGTDVGFSRLTSSTVCSSTLVSAPERLCCSKTNVRSWRQIKSVTTL